MWLGFPLFPEQASTLAPRVDALYFFLIAVSAFFTGLIFLLLFYFAIRYRRRSETEQPLPTGRCSPTGAGLDPHPFRPDHGDVPLGR